MKVKNQKLADEVFFKERAKVLGMWPGGKDVDIYEAIEYHKAMPSRKNAVMKVAEAKKNGETFICSSSGTDTIEAHRALLQYLQDQGQVDFATSYIDSLTRNCRFEDADQALKKAMRIGYSGGPLIFFWNYTKNIPLELIIRSTQYINRLMGYYEEKGVPILYGVSGAMPAISPPSLMIAPEIIEALIAAEQGVKHIQLSSWL